MSIRQNEYRNAHARRVEKGTSWGWRMTGRIAKFLLIIVGSSVALLFYAYQSAQKIPDYYRESLERPASELAESGAHFESRVLDLKNSTQTEGEWNTVFTEDQINGWLAVDLPRKFPKWLPKQISNPRVSIAKDDFKLVFKFETQRLSGIVVVSADAFCTDNDNEIGIRIRSVKSGVIPIPISKLADKITSRLRNSGISASWTEQNGDPVALISLPRKVTDIGENRAVILTGVVVDDKQIVLTGKTVLRK